MGRAAARRRRGCGEPAAGGLSAVLLRATLPESRLGPAYALDASLQEIVYAAGPGLVYLSAALLVPQAALVSAAVLGLAGAVWLAGSRPSRRWRPAPRRPDAGGRRDSPLRSAGMRRLLLALLGVGAALGALNVAALAAAERHRAGWLAAALPMALSAAGIAGGAVYHRWYRPGGDPWRRLTWLTAAFAACWLPLLVFDPPPAVAVVLVAPVGICFIPLLTIACRLVDLLAPPGRGTEANTWLVAAFGASVALGHLAGEAGGSYAVPACTATAAVAVLLTAGRRPGVPREG
ncbi:MFS transporter [Streptomyces sp. NPDC051940]|uniref:MFS transporter n=1 Tax=Streptomyces sp. NPDC051940 TaxID=3155675 RepID=UPI003447074D